MKESDAGRRIDHRREDETDQDSFEQRRPPSWKEAQVPSSKALDKLNPIVVQLSVRRKLELLRATQLESLRLQSRRSFVEVF